MSFSDIITSVLSVSAIILSVLSFVMNVIHDRKRDTLDAYNRLQNEVFDELNKYMPKDIEEICKNRKSEDYKIISGYVARIEHFCVGVNERIYSKHTVYKLAHGYFDSPAVLKRISPIIDRKSENAGEDYFANTRKVIAWMQKKGK